MTTATAFDLTTWLNDLATAGELTPEEKSSLLATLGKPKATEFVKSHQMRQADYSRAQDALRAEETRLKTEFEEKVRKENESLAQYRGEYDTRFQTTLKERLDAQNALNTIRAQITQLATDYALPEDAIKPLMSGIPASTTTTPATPSPATTSPAIDPAKFLSAEAFGKEARAFQALPIEYNRIAAEHEALFKANPWVGDSAGVCIMDKVLERARHDNIPLRAAWERECNVAVKREEVRNADVETRIKTAVADAEKRVRSEMALENPGAPTVRTTPASPALRLAGPGIDKDGHRRAIPTSDQAPAFTRAAAGASEDRVKQAIATFRTLEAEKVA